MRDTVNRDAHLQICYSLAYAHMSYNVVVWGGAANADAVLKTQKRILRLIFKLRSRESCRPIFIEHRMLTFVSLYIYTELFLQSKII